MSASLPASAPNDNPFDNLSLVSIGDLCSKMAEKENLCFHIPGYQRGYRWTPAEVRDLLDDIWRFAEKHAQVHSGDREPLYCLQPLVVTKSSRYGCLDVVDGQQRLTTIRLILGCLGQGQDVYSLCYQTREESGTFIESLATCPRQCRESLCALETQANTNIDFHYIWKACQTIDDFFEAAEINKTLFKNALLQYVRFIWYMPGEGADGKPEDIFRRLNIGKIALRDSELIKALLLNRNYKQAPAGQTDRPQQLLIRQQEIALQWDMIENALGDDEFWYFLNDTSPRRKPRPVSTRIDFIFELIYQLNKESKEFGDPSPYDCYASYKTFHYFYKYLKEKKNEFDSITRIWDAVMEVFTVLRSWFEDVELYHYVGFLLCREGQKDMESLSDDKAVAQLLRDWYASASTNGASAWTEFRKKLGEQIWKRVCAATCAEELKALEAPTYEDVRKILPKVEYDSDDSTAKRYCRPILLLHNIQTCIMQNRHEDSRFSMRAHAKFPFHLYKISGWDVEHIHSVAPNAGTDDKSRSLWLYGACMLLASRLPSAKRAEVGKLKEQLEVFREHFNRKDSCSVSEAEEKYSELKKAFGDFFGWNNQERFSDKNKIWNFALLDSSTNRSYGNSIFPVKRQILLEKDRGRRYRNLDKEKLLALLSALDKALENKLKDKSIDSEKLLGHVYEGKKVAPPFFAFIPVCTKNAFMKYYSPTNTEPNVWTNADAQHYLNDILAKLEDFYKRLNQESV